MSTLISNQHHWDEKLLFFSLSCGVHSFVSVSQVFQEDLVFLAKSIRNYVNSAKAG